MLLAVFSDSHGRPEGMRRAVESRRPDHVVFLGDGVRDAEGVMRAFPTIPFILLRGNCDVSATGVDESILFRLSGVQIFAAHGHRHGVKMDRDAFANSVCCSGSQLGLYGHTHRARIERRDGVTLMNPGSVGDMVYPTYGLVTIENGSFQCRIVELPRK